ncbi:hypothetical protein H9X96_00760 [Pedobacter sp. N36a]|uniref:hypothetical protein n=1 Tax=Pedobacter sp. N36a TaxID=2767996 RepID=UPI00165717EA|nr:hypothetical protein [Pedobacter sp. N36a]MBC8984299.1 hypothetical protein [Pedobacter sp. N36a]
MKKLVGALLLAITAVACTTPVDYKKERDEVMKFHDLVMGDHSTIVNYQMKLDTLQRNMADLKTKFPEIDTLKEKENISMLLKELTVAEDSMNDWMHKFEPDITGKSTEEAIQYFQSEKAKIVAVDSLYKKEIKSSEAYFSKFKK